MIAYLNVVLYSLTIVIEIYIPNYVGRQPELSSCRHAVCVRVTKADPCE